MQGFSSRVSRPDHAMTPPLQLARPPIVEALIDIRVKASRTLEVSHLQQIDSVLAAALPQRSTRHLAQARFETAPGGVRSASAEDLGLQGYIFRSTGGEDVAQFRIDGFTFNRLAPYSGWETIFPMAMRLWDEYVRLAAPEAATRLAVRYLNRIAIPRELDSFDSLLAAGPRIPEGLPPFVSGFLIRLTVHDLENKLAANIAQYVEESTNSVILDIECYTDSPDFELDAAHRTKFEETFASLRAFKNRVFEKSLTDSAMEKFR